MNNDIHTEKDLKIDLRHLIVNRYAPAETGQKLLAAALNTSVTVMDTASEGGPWGMAVLAAYMANKAEGETLSAYLNGKVFAGQTGTTLAPDTADVVGFDAFVENYKACFAAEHGAVDNWK